MQASRETISDQRKHVEEFGMDYLKPFPARPFSGIIGMTLNGIGEGASAMSQPAPQATGSAPAEPVPVAFLGRTSTLLLQDPAASLRRQAREVHAKLPPGWFIAAWFWDVESGGLDLEQRGHGTAHQAVDVGLPRDGGLAALLAEAASPTPRFAAVMCEDIERSGRDTFNALKLERQLDE
jgi:hypothetical protein